MTSMTCNVHETADKGHGRFETRRCTAVGVDWLDDLDLRVRWPKLNSVACIESQREWRGKIETDVRYVMVQVAQHFSTPDIHLLKPIFPFF